jgi:hypothetical protein
MLGGSPETHSFFLNFMFSYVNFIIDDDAV